MSLEYITQKIIDDANEYATDVIKKAKEEAETIAKEYESFADKEYNLIIESAYEKANEILHRANTQGVKEKRISIISTKWEYLDNVFSSAAQLLSELPEDEQLRFIVSLIHKYQRAEADLIFNAADGKRLGEKIINAVNSTPGGYKVKLSEQTDDFSGGVIIKETGAEANLTYEALVSSKREQLEDEVSAILFGEV
jgi:vacuolar-type H+-ATPase subunit E/Vma4